MEGFINTDNGYWKVLGPVALTLILSMSATYFLFLQHMVTDDQLDKLTTQVNRAIDLNTQDIKRIEAEVNKRGAAVLTIPTLQQDMIKLQVAAAEMKAVQSQIDGLRRNMQDFRSFMYSTTGRQPPPLERGEFP